jgi:magnesium-protoporphyrin O-methyltransferase
MSCCSHCQESGDLFDEEKARGELRSYRENGTPESPTSLLVGGLKTLDLEDRTLPDVGGGIGMIPCELLPAGVSESHLVEASAPYLEVAEKEARRRGYADRTEFEYGDFVDLAPDLPEADLVTLDRVFCCYPHMERLVEASTAKAGRWYGVSYPKERWYNKIISGLAAAYCWAREMYFRIYIHSGIQETIEAQGFERFYQTGTVIWQVELYEREGALA